LKEAAITGPDHTYGIVSPEDLAGLSGLDMLRAMIAGRLPAPPMAGTLGFRLVEAEAGRVLFEGTPSARFLNPLGSVHRGWAPTHVDSAAGCALHSELSAGTGYTTVETKANFTRGISPETGAVRCEGRLLTRGRHLATAEASLTDLSGRILAHGTSTLMILPPRA
jgi:uncharacterized protein (TIGR00369 family)